MKQVICDMNLFDYEHKIMVLDMDTMESKLMAKTTNDNIGVDIAKCCQMAETYSVHLYGNDNFVNEYVVPVIQEYLGSTYGLDELEIEVN